MSARKERAQLCIYFISIYYFAFQGFSTPEKKHMKSAASADCDSQLSYRTAEELSSPARSGYLGFFSSLASHGLIQE